MLRIKRLDIFIVKSFLLLFIGTFFICLFIFMMQFLWRYVDELVGKGLEMSVMAQFFFYSALSLVPLSLPLAVLLASLITFGNFGERYELLAMKAAGISLLKIMRPLIILVCIICGISFYFQNVIGPIAQGKLGTLLISMKQKSPEVDIPEGVFYSEIPDYNLKVRKKDRKTGMLYDVLIYNFKDGAENAHIIYADSGRMEMTADKQHLYLHLYSGELVENLKSQNVKAQNVDSLFEAATLMQKQKILSSAANRAESLQGDYGFKIYNMRENDYQIRRHGTEWHKKITISLSCLLFFFIGAPLGGIIRKGGLGMPVIVSVLVFIVYYVIDNSGYKMARDGKWIVWMGMWLSSAILAPLGAFLTYKSNNDSVVLNADAYTSWIKRVIGIRGVRHLFKKEVIIHDPDYSKIFAELTALTTECRAYISKHQLKKAPNYFKLWMSTGEDDEVKAINERLETLIEELSNSRSFTLLTTLNNYPIIPVAAHVRPFHVYWLNLLAGAIVPIGLFFYFRIWIFRIRLVRDIEKVIKTNEDIQFIIKENHNL